MWGEGSQLVKVNNQVVLPERPKPKIASIEKWTDAFLVNTSLFIDVHPHWANELITCKYT